MNNKKRNILLICAAILIGSYIARPLITAYMRMAYERHQPPPPDPKKPPAPDPGAAALAAEAAAMGNLSGVWLTKGRVPGGRGQCDLRLELKQSEPGHYAGFSRFACMSMPTNPQDANAIQNYLDHFTNPDSAIMSGIVDKGSIHFHADKTIGLDINGCSVTEMTVTPFGASAIAAEWKEGTCPGGSLMMTRTGN